MWDCSMTNDTDLTTIMLETMQSGDTRRVNVYAQLAKQRPTVIEQAANVTAVYAVDEATA